MALPHLACTIPLSPRNSAWDLGRGWGVSYLIGYYTAIQGTISSSSNSVNQRVALGYTANGWNLTTNNILGLVDHPLTNYPHGSPCPSLPSKGCNTDFYNNDITATKTFGNWDLGPVGFYSTDLNKPNFELPEAEPIRGWLPGRLPRRSGGSTNLSHTRRLSEEL